MSEPLVSAVIIFLNARAWLEEAVASVLGQSYEPIELVLVDDGSTDGTRDLAESLAQRHGDQIRLVAHPGRENRGMSASRNLGVRQSRGEYLAMLDADDVWLPDKTRQQVDVLESNPRAAMVYGRTQLWHSWRAGSERCDELPDLGVEPDRMYEPPELFCLLLANRAQTPTTCNAMFRRAAFDQVGRFEEAFRGLYEDQVFFAKIHLHFPSYVANNVWARYRQHERAKAERFSFTEYYRQRREFMRWLADYLPRTPTAGDARVGKLVADELWRSNHPTWAAVRRRSWPWPSRSGAERG